MKTLDGFNKEMGQAISSISFMFILPNKMLILNFPLDKI